MIWPFKKKPISWSEAVTILNSITYKPNVSLGWVMLPKGRFVLDIQAQVFNADDPPSAANVTMIRMQNIMKHQSEEQILNDVMRVLIRLETHEAREFFRYRGIKVFDPHAVPMALINGT